MMSKLGLWLALRVVHLVATVVPVEARKEWRLEWEGELQHLAARTNTGLLSRAIGALPDAAWFRHLLRANQSSFRITTRRLLRAPAFVAATVGTLTLGLGMFAVVYTVFDRVLMEPMPYKAPEDLYYVWRDFGPIRDDNRARLRGNDVLDLQNAGGVIESAAALQPFLGGVFSLREGTDPMEISVMVASPNVFDMLGVLPMLGRGFAADDAGPSLPYAMVLTYEFWNQLGAERDVIGKVVRMNGNPHRVIGVLPPDFKFVRNDARGPAQRPDAYTTLRVKLSEPSPNQADYSALIRARSGTSPEVVAAAVDTVGRAVDARDFNGRGLKFYATPLKADLVAKIRPALLVLGAAGVVLAVMLMVNLSSVLLARGAQREQEFAVSRALGASRSALMRATLIEGALLGLMGGVLGTLAAIWGTRLLVALAPLDLPRRDEIAVDWGGVAVVVGIGALLGLLAAAVPAFWAAHSSLSALLARGSVRGGGGHGVMRRSMIVTQVALSLVLLSSGALVVRSLEHLLRADPGFRPEGVFTALIRTPPVFFPQISDVQMFQSRVNSALASLPGVDAASAASALPLTVSPTLSAPATITIPGAPGNTGDGARDALLTDVIAARSGYVEVMGMRVIAGRSFEKPRTDGVLEVLVDTTFARHFFPGTDAIGKQIPSRGNSAMTIVGVVDQARLYDLHEDGRAQLYIRAEDNAYRPLFYVMRTKRDPRSLIPEMRAALRQIDPRVAVGEARSMEEIVGNALRQQRTSATLITAFAVGALLLAAMGLFGVVSGSVTRRSHELAVRMALGSDPSAALRLVLREGAFLVCVGLLIGLPGVLAAGSLVRAMLVGVSPSDPLTLTAVVLMLLAVTLLTCYVPARRVLRLDPARLLGRNVS